jgi:Peptidase family M28/PDZ domain
MHRKFDFGFLLCALTTLAGTATHVQAASAEARSAAASSITAGELREYVNTLADDTFEGREAGTRGNRAAGIYIVEQLKKHGLRGGGPGGSFYQNGGGNSNILAVVDGSDPHLASEVILVGAHYDHVGYGTFRNSYGPTGYIHNGADDNASGVAALVEVAEAVNRLPEKPKRSVLFAFWDGEEKGLLGSKYWVEHPTVPLANVRLAMNADMVGRLRSSRLEVFGIRTAPGLRRLVSRQNTARLNLDFNWDVKGDSDHYTFFSRDVPILMMHTGMHGDYHRPSDDADKVNTEGLAQVAELMFNVVVELADAPNLGGFRAQSRRESQWTKRSQEVVLPPPRGRLGLTWDEVRAGEGAVVVASVVPGSAAAVGGLRPGDRIVRFAGGEVHDADKFRIAVLAAKNPVPVSVERPGEDAPVEMTLELAGEPVRLGISWRTDAAEPDSVIVNRVTPGSPAALAGLKPGDRIHRIGGRDFATGDEFRELATRLPSPLVLEVESGGRVRTVEAPQVEAETSSAPAGEESAQPAHEPTKS